MGLESRGPMLLSLEENEACLVSGPPWHAFRDLAAWYAAQNSYSKRHTAFTATGRDVRSPVMRV